MVSNSKKAVIDWQEALNLTSNNPEIAQKLLAMFVEYLDKFEIDAKEAVAADDIEASVQ